jgi:prevent-host-death family protein
MDGARRSDPCSRGLTGGPEDRRGENAADQGPSMCTIYLYRRVWPMKTVSVAEARRRLKALLDEVSSGHQVSVVRRGREVARLVPPRRSRRRLPGSFPRIGSRSR